MVSWSTLAKHGQALVYAAEVQPSIFYLWGREGVCVELACVCRDNFTVRTSRFTVLVSCCGSAKESPRGNFIRRGLLGHTNALCMLSSRFRPSRFGPRILE